MNQEKIGKLIAKLRKEKNLTQRQLGEMVGVGYRAVSKWETGLTLPDISIINELCTILGISSDELLKGEINPKENNIEALTNNNKPNNKNKRKLFLILIPLLIIAITVIGLLIIKDKNEISKEYIIQSLKPDEYQVDGVLAIENDSLTLNINKIKFQNYDFFQKQIKNYEYKVLIDNIVIFGYGGSNEFNNIEDNKNIKSFFNNFKINYYDEIKANIIDGKIVIKFILTDTDDAIIEKNIETILINS